MGFGFKCRPGRYAVILGTVALGVMLAAPPAAEAASAKSSPPPTTGTALEWEFSGVSCASASACTAVGDYVTTADTAVALVETWNGTAWTVRSTPTPAGGTLNGVSCTSASACTAVGQSPSTTGGPATLAESWNGTAWTIQSTPHPSGATFSYLNGVSCTSPSACTATGYYQTSAGVTSTLAESWNGAAWTIQSTPNPSGATFSYLSGVSCTSTSACTTTGESETSTGVTTALAETWNGTAWAIQSTPNPSGAEDSELYGVSCTSASACTAAGNSETAAGVTTTLAETWNGAAWSIQSTPNPSAATAAYLSGVSCLSASACTAVGWYDTTSGVYETLAETWNGTAWAIQSTPNLSGATASYLLGVSCPAASACTAAGYNLNPTYETLAEHWNGTAWATQSTPTP
jgi:hypothetical protein